MASLIRTTKLINGLIASLIRTTKLIVGLIASLIRTTKLIWLLFCTNHAADAEWMIHAREGRDTRRVWITSSADEGDC